MKLGTDGSVVTSISFSPSGKYIVSASFGLGDHDDYMSVIQLWNTKTGELEVKYAPFGKDFESDAQKVYVVFSPDGRHIISSSVTSSWAKHTLAPIQVHLRSIETGDTTLLQLGQSIRSLSLCISFSPNGKYIAAGSWDNTLYSNCQWDDTIQLWNIETDEVVFKSFKAHKDGVKHITFSADGEYIVACSPSKEIRVWTSETGEAVCESESLALSQDLEYPIQDIAMSPDRRYYVTDIHTGTVTVLSQKYPIQDIAMSPDGKYIVISDDHTVQLRTIKTDRPDSLVEPIHLGRHRQTWIYSKACVSFSPDQKYIVSASEDSRDHIIRIYHNNLNAADQTWHHRAAQPSFLHQYPIGSSPKLNEEGWLHYPSGELLLWVRPELRSGLYLPGIAHVIGAHSVKIDLRKFVHGTEWLKCQEARCEPAVDPSLPI